MHIFIALNYASCKSHEGTTKQSALERDSDEHYDTEQLTVQLNQQQTPHKADIAVYTNEIERTPLYPEFDWWKFFFKLLLHFLLINNSKYVIQYDYPSCDFNCLIFLKI